VTMQADLRPWRPGSRPPAPHSRGPWAAAGAAVLVLLLILVGVLALTTQPVG
jgi:hypothetical protein